jgi:hypothetical protein
MHEGRIHHQESSVARRSIHALHDALEQAAKLRLAVAQGVFGAAPFDRDAGDLRHARHQLMIAGQWQPGLALIRRKRPDDGPVRCNDGRGPRGTQARVSGGFAAELPQGVGFDVGHRDLTG